MKDIRGDKNPSYKSGLRIKGNPFTGIYNSWISLRQRCFNKNNPKFHRYGGRGITVCEEWQDINKFKDWALKNGWEKGKQIDRINNDGNYEPSNCRWISRSENSRKKSTTKIDMITAQEIRSRIKENWYDLAKEYGCSHGNIWFIMKNFTHIPEENKCAEMIRKRKKQKLK